MSETETQSHRHEYCRRLVVGSLTPGEGETSAVSHHVIGFAVPLPLPRRYTRYNFKVRILRYEAPLSPPVSNLIHPGCKHV